MTDPSLFPDIAPDKEPRDPWKPSCCDGLTPPPNVPIRAWEYMHAIGHSRVPFTVEAFEALVECTQHQAVVAIRHAGQHGWIDPVLPEKYMREAPRQWVGCLPRRR